MAEPQLTCIRPIQQTNVNVPIRPPNRQSDSLYFFIGTIVWVIQLYVHLTNQLYARKPTSTLLGSGTPLRINSNRTLSSSAPQAGIARLARPDMRNSAAIV